METLTSKMRTLAIENLKARREEIFQRTRNIINMKESEEEEDSVHSNENYHQKNQEVEKTEEMEEEQFRPQHKGGRKRKQKHTHNDYKTKRYWRRLLQVSDWLVSVPLNISQFYVGVRGDGCKCLMIMKYSSIQICDKSGNLVHEFKSSAKTYNGTILEIYFNAEDKSIIVSDMIVWKSNPMTGSEFQFRCAWLQSNLNIKTIQQETLFDVYFTQYYPCTAQNLKFVYQQNLPFKKEGLLFVHKDSPYEHGLNPNVLIWKDQNISSFFLEELAENKEISRGVGYINKEGEVKSVENVRLFSLDRTKIDPSHKFAKFTYSSIEIGSLSEQTVEVKIGLLTLVETTRNHYGPVDSLGKLFYKSSIKHGAVRYQQLMSALNCTMMAE